MENIPAKKKPDPERVSTIGLLIFGAVFFVLLLGSLFGGKGSSRIRQTTTSDLINTKEISTLSVSEFVYNGIAQKLKENGDPDYNVLYRSTVKASVDAEKISYSIDEKNKTLTFVFPEITVEKPVIDVGAIRLIPDKKDLYIDDVIKLCREDANNEAQQSGKLISSAEDNIRSIMEAWYTPIFEGYTFEYVFNGSEGGDAK